MVRPAIPAANRFPAQLLVRERPAALAEKGHRRETLLGEQCKTGINARFPVPDLLERRSRIRQLTDAIAAVARLDRSVVPEVDRIRLVRDDGAKPVAVRPGVQVARDLGS